MPTLSCCGISYPRGGLQCPSASFNYYYYYCSYLCQGYVFTLFVCLLAGLRKKNYSTAFHTEFGALDVGGGPNLDADPRTFNGILPPWW